MKSQPNPGQSTMPEWSRGFEVTIWRLDHGGYEGRIETVAGDDIAEITSPSPGAVVDALAEALLDALPDESEAR